MFEPNRKLHITTSQTQLSCDPNPSHPLRTTYTLELGADVLANTSFLSLTTTDNTAVHSTRHAVLLLDVQLGESVL